MNESALVWGLEAEEREGVAVMELVDEEIALLQEDIAILRRALLNDDVDLRLATPARENRAKELVSRVDVSAANPLNNSYLLESPKSSPVSAEDLESQVVDLEKLSAYANKGRVIPFRLPAGVTCVADLGTNSALDWREKGRLMMQQRGHALRNEEVLEWLCADGRNKELLSFVFHEFEFIGFDLELAFRFFLERLMYLPKEGQKQTRLISAFGARYFFDCPKSVRSSQAATALASSLFMLHTMLHHAAVSKNFAFDLQGWLEHANGLNVDESGSPGDFDEGMLVDAFANVRDQEFVFQDGGSSNTPQFRLKIAKQGWIEVHEIKGRRTSGTTLGGAGSALKRARNLWTVLEKRGFLRFWDSPKGELKREVSLENASISSDDSNSLTLSSGETRLALSFRSAWALSTWRVALERHSGKPFPGIRVHNVPSEQLITAKHASPVVTHVTNPVFRPPPLKTPVKRTENPVFQNETLEALLSPKGEKEKKEKTTPNPLYYRRYSSSPNFSHHIVKFQNPIYNQEIPTASASSPPDKKQNTENVEHSNPLFGLDSSIVKKPKKHQQ